jgi:CRISPR system Cascade subunit CasB
MTEEKKHPLITFLEQHTDDRAMLAELRRGLGRTPGEAASMFPYVMPFIGNRYEEDNLFLVASLFALHPVSSKSGNLGQHLHSYVQVVGDAAATTRRFVQLLNLRRETLDTPLRQHISLLKAQEIPVNWHQLIRDLGYWSHEDRFVQKEWASAYWPPQKSKSNTKKS